MRTKINITIKTLALLLLLTACGADTSGPKTPTAQVSGVTLSTGAESMIAASESPSIAIIATVNTDNGENTEENVRTLAGITVNFSTTLGKLVDDEGNATNFAITNEAGVARLFLQAGTITGIAEITSSVSGFVSRATVEFLPGSPASITLIGSSPQLPSANTSPVTLTAFVRDQHNNLMENQTVTFTATNDGTIQVVRATTDETGTAQALLSTPGNRSNRDIEARASVGQISETMTVRVSGTTISVSGPSSATLGNPVELLISLQDSNGNGIPNREVVAESRAGNSIDGNLTTNSSGQATAVVMLEKHTGDNSDIITFHAKGTSSMHTIELSTDFFAFVDPEPHIELPISTNHNLTIKWLHDGAPVSGAIVFSASRGSIAQNEVVTNPATGEATITISSSIAGISRVTAVTNSGLSTSIDFLFVATEASHMTLQAHPAVIGTNTPGESNEQSEIVAVLRDSVGNFVKNQTVHFSLNDISGGTLHPSTVVTDSMGRASTTYIAGSSASARDGVEIVATLPDNPVVKETTTLTSAKRTLYITLGTGNEVNEPDSTRYALPYGVLVTDAAGGPVANTEISLSVWPTNYYKGYYVWSGVIWEPVRTSPACPNEDYNRDGIYTSEKDYNENQKLDPGNVVALSTNKVVTNNEGFAEFDLLYLQDYANWIEVELTARSLVAGSEDVEVIYFTIPVLADDIDDIAVRPPGQPSPFGSSSSCYDYLGEDEKIVGSITVRTASDSAVASADSPPIAVMATVTATDGSAITNETVHFSTTLGTLVDSSGNPQSQAQTNSQGIATIYLQPGDKTGTAIIQAYKQGFPAQETIQLLPGAPALLLLNAEPEIIATSTTSSIKATVLDNNDNPVPDEEVVFTITHNPSLGELSEISDNTDANGNISVELVAGSIEGILTIRARTVSNSIISYIDVEISDN